MEKLVNRAIFFILLMTPGFLNALPDLNDYIKCDAIIQQNSDENIFS